MVRFYVSALAASATLLMANAAAADTVALLSLGTGDTVVAQANVRDAVAQLNHNLVSPSIVDAARLKVQDGMPDSSAEYMFVASETKANWTVAGQVTPLSGGYRIELVACQATNGRVESLARDIIGTNAVAQLQELLGYLLRPGGIGSTAIQWKVVPIAGQPSSVAASGSTVNTVQQAPKAPEPPALSHDYAERHPIAPGAGIGFYGALARPANARGSSFSSSLELTLGYALPEVTKGLEARGNVGFSIAGPASFHIDAGARYALPILASARVYAGPEASVGIFAPFGGDEKPRLLLRAAGFLAVGIGEQFQAEVLAELAAAPGGSGALVLGGGQLRGSVRF
jgi:hypothetical protein